MLQWTYLSLALLYQTNPSKLVHLQWTNRSLVVLWWTYLSLALLCRTNPSKLVHLQCGLTIAWQCYGGRILAWHVVSD